MFSKNKNIKVVVAMSGGVDSSVSAALLKEAGYNVVGVFMRCWNADDFSSGECTAEEDEYWARRAAWAIGIPFYSVDLVDDYKKRVVAYFVKEYGEGRTPNPDVMCNKEIKFGVFFDKVMSEFKADYMATGHYARIKKDSGGFHMLKGIDSNKDQTYFIYRISQDKLSRIMFPVGEYTKSKVRELARKFGLPNAEKKDSQGICFIGKVDVSEFLREYIPANPGDVITTKGKIVGKHEGVQFYTVGQRKGIGTHGGGVPYYVVDKDVKGNKLIVATKYDKALLSKKLRISDITWLNGRPELPVHIAASIRYRQKPQGVKISKNTDNTLLLEFYESQRAVTSGQSVVIYNGDEVVGGGVII